MIQGIGTDIIEIERIRKAVERYGHRFLNRIYTHREQEYCLAHRDSAPRLAGRFAAKEAVLKAIGTGLRTEISWLDIEIINNHDGKPEVVLSDHLKELLSFDQNSSIEISISHCHAYATAFAIRSTQNERN